MSAREIGDVVRLWADRFGADKEAILRWYSNRRTPGGGFSLRFLKNDDGVIDFGNVIDAISIALDYTDKGSNEHFVFVKEGFWEIDYVLGVMIENNYKDRLSQEAEAKLSQLLNSLDALKLDDLKKLDSGRYQDSKTGRTIGVLATRNPVMFEFESIRIMRGNPNFKSF